MKKLCHLVFFAVPALALSAAQADNDNPDQAAARAALMQKMSALAHPGSPAAPAKPATTTTNAAAAVAGPVPDQPQPPPAPAVPAMPAPAKPPAKPAPPAANLVMVGTRAVSPDSGANARAVAEAAGFPGQNAQIEKMEADGVVVSYTPAGGGIAITKIYFDSLPPGLRQRLKQQ